ncbi:S8 family serine peptidase [Kineococcus gynurae]|uniref:S8 family serine peptidase n=1 Tax=Kineococcus gynurae TaxID=452979 RepID=A0ABV5LWK0_9ACTN
MLSRPRPGRTTRRRFLGTVAAVTTIVVAGAGGAVAAPGGPSPLSPEVMEKLFPAGRYVVALAGASMADYTGDVPGIARLQSADGSVTTSGSDAEEYRARLLREQSDVAGSADVTPAQRYTVALNGFSADLTSKQAAALSGADGVVSVTPDRLYHPQAATTADYLGLSGPGGVWAGQGGPADAGRGTVVGVLDTGIWPENPMVAGEALGSRADADEYQAYRTADGEIHQRKADGGTYTGACETGQDFTAADCSTKLVGARAFSEGFEAAAPLAEDEYSSARDQDGHGTHTATTAAGNANVPATIDGRSYGPVSGVAPGASIAAYKVCWDSADGESGCTTSDILAALDAAVADNVDVINFSIGGEGETVDDPIQLAMLSAASAGIFIAASAGNSGPDADTLSNLGPWVTTVGAATAVDREGTIVLGDGRKFVGARLEQVLLGRRQLRSATTLGFPGKTADEVRLCGPGSLDPVRTRNLVVVCDRGTYDRVAKSAEVRRAGGAGMILVNPTPNSLDPDAHTVPTIHVDTAAGEAIKAYVARSRGANVLFQPGNTTGTPTPTPQIAGFSSRGPTTVADGDVLKPDVAAPGVGIIAGYSPDALRGNDFAPESGTSMSSPHVAGLAALYLAARPSASPMQVKSALMTTARPLVDAAGQVVDDTFSAGAGFVDPTRYLTPGLTYESTPREWLAYLEGAGVRTGTGARAVDPSDLNQASISVGDFVGTRTVTRRVTARTAGIYSSSADVPGFAVRVSPEVLYFDRAGQTKEFRVTLTRTDAPTGRWNTGSLTWRGAGLRVDSPIALNTLDSAAPASVGAPLEQGAVDVDLVSGVGGPLDVTSTGLVGAEALTGDLSTLGMAQYGVVVPEGTEVARFDLRADAADADLDLYVYRITDDGEAVEVGRAASADPGGVVDVRAPEPGQYVAALIGFDTDGDRGGYRFSAWTLGPQDTGVGDFGVYPDPVQAGVGRAAQVTATWDASALDPRTSYLGLLRFGQDSDTVIGVG